MRALAEDTEPRRRLIEIARRTRRRLHRIGLVLRHESDGTARVLHRHGVPRPLESDDDISASAIVKYIRERRLFFGEQASAPSWGLALSTLKVNDARAQALASDGSALVSKFVQDAVNLISSALDGEGEYPKNLLLRDVPIPVRELWRKCLRLQKATVPFMVRPDFVLGSAEALAAVEFNVDTRLDRGIAVGVTEYSAPMVRSGERILSDRLVVAYAEECVRLARRPRPVVVIVVSDSARREYRAQEEFFGRSLHTTDGIDCRLRTSEQLLRGYTGRLVDRLDGSEVDVVIPELELVDLNDRPNNHEVQFYDALLESDTAIIGSPLPFADKVLLAMIPDYHLALGLVRIVPAMLVDSEAVRKILESDQSAYVLKQTGVHLASTGSKSVVIGRDVSLARIIHEAAD